MDKYVSLKDAVSTAAGLLGGFVTMFWGGWSQGLTALVFIMAADYVTGLLVAGVFKKSKKTDSGGLESKAGLKGLIRKVSIIILIGLIHMVEGSIGIDFLMNGCIIGFMLNELISLVENFGLMGIPMPAAVTRAIDILTTKANPEQPGFEDVDDEEYDEEQA